MRRRIERIAELLHAKDLDALALCYSEDVVSFDVEPPLAHRGRAAKMRNWEKVFAAFDEVTYEVRDLTVAAGGDVAFAHAFGRLGGTLGNGTAVTGMWVRATFCMRLIEGEWLIVHDQASVPFDLSTGKGVTNLEP
ncbi:ketosteroid isomerase [Microbacterium mangrovi]|uniref:Ketosteroid isomerase n=1 Tax=Microbacterium mangrovi TaxID=1348253 RepID=A0A0B2A315_9MICO|nr:ketosteroid isomerase [Microbacterium mangrovi]